MSRNTENTETAKYRCESWLREEYIQNRRTMREIAEDCDVCKSTIRNWINRYGIKTRSLLECRRPSDSPLRDEDWLRKQYIKNQQHPSEIAEKCDVHAQTVRRWLNRHGIETRTAKEAQRLSTDPKLKDENWLREQYRDEGRTLTDIGDECSVTYATVLKWINRHGIDTYYGQIPVDSPMRHSEWVREQYVENQRTVSDIADECKVSVPTVLNWMDRHSIERRAMEDAVPTGEDHPQWQGGKSSYGPGWGESKRQLVRERDNHTCQYPGCELTSKDHQELYGLDLHVHHLLKASDVEDPEKRNAPKNLITLCFDHHNRFEKISEAGIRPQFESIGVETRD